MPVTVVAQECCHRSVGLPWWPGGQHLGLQFLQLLLDCLLQLLRSQGEPMCCSMLMALASADHLCLGLEMVRDRGGLRSSLSLFSPVSHPAVLNDCSSLSIATSGPTSDAVNEFLFFYITQSRSASLVDLWPIQSASARHCAGLLDNGGEPGKYWLSPLWSLKSRLGYYY